MPKRQPHSEHVDGAEKVGDLVSIFRRGQIWYANYQADGRQVRRSLKTSSKKEARRLALALERELLQAESGERVEPVTLEVAIDAYEDYLRTEGRAERTLAKYRGVLQRFHQLATSRGVARLDQIRPHLMDEYRSSRHKLGREPKTIFNESIVIRQLLRFAYSRRMVTDDPLRGYKLRKPKPKEQPCWTVEQVQSIVEAAKEPYKSAFQVLAGTGLRAGELSHLTWKDIDFGANVIHVRAKEGWTPKTGNRRAVPMTAQVRAILEKLPRKHRWVFVAPPSRKYPSGGRRMSERLLLANLKKLLKQLDLPGHVHTFRHTFISLALMARTPEAVVRAWVGHVDAATLKLYTHIADAASQAAMQDFARKLGQKPPEESQ